MESEEPIISMSLKKRTGSLGMWKACKCDLYKGYLRIKQGYSNPVSTKINITSKTVFRNIDSNHMNNFVISDSIRSDYFLAESDTIKTQLEQAIRSLQLQRQKLNITDFNIISELGKGYFGKVLLAEHKETHDIYALKAIKKAMILEEKKLDTIFTERNILCGCSHPFIVTIYFAFQTDKKFYFGLEYVPGGSLFKFIQMNRKMELEEIVFYAAEVVLALSYLHSKGILYRDLKLENVLLCQDGHIKLTDFGLSKELTKQNGNYQSTSTFCGTSEYLPPEMIQDKPYGLEMDWWTLGVFIYEFLFSETPFYDKNTNKMYKKIVHNEPTFPEHAPKVAVDFIKRLLNKDPSKRPTVSEIKDDPFFANINWDDVYNKKLIPPYIPRVQAKRMKKRGRARLDSDVASVEFNSGFEGFTFAGAF